MNHDSRVDQAVRSIEDAMVALTRAICLLGFSEGKEIVQNAHGVVAGSRTLLHQQGLATTRPGAEDGGASSPVAAHALVARALGGEPRR
jgi:hypothetical protein